MSITRRLIVYLTLFVTTLWLITAVITRSVFIDEIDEIRATSIRNAAFRLMPLVVHSVATSPADGLTEPGAGSAVELDEDLRFVVSGIGGALAFQVRDPDGAVVLQSYDSKGLAFPASTRPGLDQSGDTLAFTVTDALTGLSLTVVEPKTHRREAVSEATAALFVPLLLLVPIMIAGVYLITRTATWPIRDLRRRIARLDENDVDELESGTKAAELRPIARTIDQLLKRLGDIIRQEKSVSASIAHEMRSPVAGALLQVQRLRQDSADVMPARIDKIEAALRRLASVTEKMIQLSRFGTVSGPTDMRVNLMPVVKLTIAEFGGGQEPHRRISLVNNLNQDLAVAIDPDVFGIALRNLIENALIHGAEDAVVRVTIERDWTVHVINDGVVTSPDALAGLIGKAVDGSTPETGEGLGLAIANRLMTQSGGGLELHSPALGVTTGFEAILRLP